MWLIQFFEWLKTVWDRVTFWIVIDEYDRGLILRLGKFAKELEPGISFKFPLIDKVLSATVVIATMKLPPQTIHTYDGEQITLIAIIKYSIDQIKPYLLEIVDREDVLGDVGPCIIKDIINSTNYKIVARGIETKVKKRLKSEVGKYGFNIHKITFATQAKIKTIRLITTPLDPADA